MSNNSAVRKAAEPNARRRASDDNRITGDLIFRYGTCRHWPYFDAHGDAARKREMGEWQTWLLTGRWFGLDDKLKDLGAVFVAGKTELGRERSTLKLMREGASLIAGARLRHADLLGEPDLLERQDDATSIFGHWLYRPVSLRNAERLNDQHKLKLCLESAALAGVQGALPQQACLDDGWGGRACFDPAEYEERFQLALSEIRASFAGVVPELRLGSGCRQSPWLGECVRLAEAADDIARLYGVKDRLRAALRRHGLGRVGDLAQADIDWFMSQEPLESRRAVERAMLQAQSLVENAQFLRRPVNLPEASLELFFDIEGDPLRRVEYLFGFWARDGGDGRYFSFLAERPEDEMKMWQQFLEWCETLPEGAVTYHYGDYEPARVERLAARYGDTPALRRFLASLFDLNETVKDCLVLPLYFYGLKDIGKFIGFERSGIASGADSVGHYERWLTTGDRQLLDEIVAYNRDDVLETAHLKDWLAGL